MKKFSIIALVCLGLNIACAVSVFASGGGHHSHGHEAEVGPGENVTHKDTQGGVDAYLEFCKSEKPKTASSDESFLKCVVKASLKDSKSGKSITPSRLILRTTKGHDQFGEALVFSVNEHNVLETNLFVKEKGEHHYLLIADIEGVGIKEFHFHHMF